MSAPIRPLLGGNPLYSQVFILMDQSTKLIKVLSPQHLISHKWTNEERVFKRKERVLKEIEYLDIHLRSALLYRLSRSVFGPFLKELNTSQCQDYLLNENKWQILQWQLKRYNEHDTNIVYTRNAFLRNYRYLLNKAVNDCDTIDLNFLEKHLRCLNLDCCFIKKIDNALQNFENIKVLTLCGNFIKDIDGTLLPRKLVFLELFDNFIDDLGNLVRQTPKTIQHLGLGRNRLKDDSRLHLLAKSKNLPLLQSIDLSDNDISDLASVIENLKPLQSIKSLTLEGNPCAVSPQYKFNVLKHFPYLDYLDATQILEADRNEVDSLEDFITEEKPELIFECYRILGLPEPPKDKKNIQTIHVEVNFPLLVKLPEDQREEIDSVISTDSFSRFGKEEMINPYSKESKNDKKDKGKKSKHDIESNKGKINHKKKKSYYGGQNEYYNDFEEQNVWFKTQRMPWTKVIQFRPIHISRPENTNQVLRDTFRSIVPVRIVYLKVSPVLAKPKKRTNKSPRKDKQQLTNELPKEENIEEQPRENIIKRITLASFYCDLKSLNWSDNALDFYWADHPDLGVRALRVQGDLRALEYDLNAPQGKRKKEPNDDKTPRKESLPKVLTCQVGFGLNRNRLN